MDSNTSRLTVLPAIKIFAYHCSLNYLFLSLMHRLTTAIILFILSITSLAWCVYRDIQIEKQYPGDLRNRILGARLQMDGISPYYYRWQPGDSLRYYDPEGAYTRKFSNVTSTPFFHQLLYPIANLSQRSISKLWLFFQYLMLVIMTVLALVAGKFARKRLIIIISLLFLYTYAWTTQVDVGQMYLFIPFIAFLLFFFLSGKHAAFNAAIAGILAATLILIKPTTIVFFIPFILLLPQFSRKYILTAGVSFLLVLLLAFGSHQSRMYWTDYRHAMKDHISMHQGEPFERITTAPLPRIKGWEGWNMDEVEKEATRFHYQYNGEHGNVFVVVNSALHTKLPVTALALACGAFILVLFTLYYRKYQKTAMLNLYTVALLGFCFYMATDLFSPVHRFLYNTSQLIFPLLLIAALHPVRIPKIYLALLFLSFLLNTVTIHLLPLQASIGEYLAFATIIAILFTSKPQPAR